MEILSDNSICLLKSRARGFRCRAELEADDRARCRVRFLPVLFWGTVVAAYLFAYLFAYLPFKPSTLQPLPWKETNEVGVCRWYSCSVCLRCIYIFYMYICYLQLSVVFRVETVGFESACVYFRNACAQMWQRTLHWSFFKDSARSNWDVKLHFFYFLFQKQNQAADRSF